VVAIEGVVDVVEDFTGDEAGEGGSLPRDRREEEDAALS